jgi:hypothetical protein
MEPCLIWLCMSNSDIDQSAKGPGEQHGGSISTWRNSVMLSKFCQWSFFVCLLETDQNRGTFNLPSYTPQNVPNNNIFSPVSASVLPILNMRVRFIYTSKQIAAARGDRKIYLSLTPCIISQV